MKHHLSPYFNELKLADLVSAYLGNPFISTWQVGTNYGDKSKTHAMDITLPLDADGTYDFVVEWGDGSSAHILSHDQADVKHTYARAGEYTVQLNGIVNGFAFGAHENDDDDDGHPCSEQIIDISQWGCVRLANKGSQFNRCTYLKVSAKDVLDLTGVTCMDYMFYDASSFNGDVGQWNTGSVTSMHCTFCDAWSFNGDVSQWNTGSVVNMNWMFEDAWSFNGDVSQWNTGSVVDMRGMFFGASSFNMDQVRGWSLNALTQDRA